MAVGVTFQCQKSHRRLEDFRFGLALVYMVKFGLEYENPKSLDRQISNAIFLCAMCRDFVDVVVEQRSAIHRFIFAISTSLITDRRLVGT